MKTINLFFLLLFFQIIKAQTVSTYAGTGLQGSTDGNATLASFTFPQGICIDATGNIYVADTTNNIIRKITADGIVTTIAGTAGVTGWWNGQGSAAAFYLPIGITVAPNGYLYVADTFNNKIRKISPSGEVTTFSGVGSGNIDGDASVARFSSPQGIVLDSNGNLFIADYGNHKIRKVESNGFVTTFAGTGSSGSTDGNGIAASFNRPASITIDGNDNLYVVESFGQKIRKITPTADVTTIAGNGTIGNNNGIGSSANFNYPSGIAIDNSNNLFITDTNNNVIRKIDTNGNVSTFAGTGSQGFNNGAIDAATFRFPKGITIDQNGNLYITDNYNHSIRKITSQNLSAPDIDNHTFIIYPNPFTSSVNIKVKDNTKSTLQIIDFNGRIIVKEQLCELDNKIDTSNLIPGMYIFKINSSQKNSIYKMIKI